MKSKKFHSIHQQVIRLPLLVLGVVLIIVAATVYTSYTSIEKKMIESNANALQISLNQLVSRLNEIDFDFVQYITFDETYQGMSRLTEEATATDYFLYQMDTIKWLNQQLLSYYIVDGACVYYSKIDLLIFRDRVNKKNIHAYFREQFQVGRSRYNHWEIIEFMGEPYLTVIKHYGSFYWGCWISLENLPLDFGLEEESLLGSVYFIDQENNNTVADSKINAYIKANGNEKKSMVIESEKYRNISAVSKHEDLRMGMIIPPNTVLKRIPYLIKFIFVISGISVLLVIGMIAWLQLKIAKPLKMVDSAMKRISLGDLEYRIPAKEKKHYDEYDQLIRKFNEMMDDINDLEFSLYATKIKEQRTELKYISQQIRPHFILNALNVIYTYEQEEFPLVKKMVLYLSEYFQYIVNLKYDYVEVEKELRHIDNYLKIQHERYPERVTYQVEMEEQVRNYLIPPLLIQTFVENCIKYAMKNKEPLLIQIIAQDVKGNLRLLIQDNGNGFTQETLELIHDFIKTKEYKEHLGIGIQNSIDRLDMLYPKGYGIIINNGTLGGACIEINLPKEPDFS